MRYRRKKTKKNCGVCFHAEKNGMCSGKKMGKVNMHKNTQNYKLQNLQNLVQDK